MSSPSATTDRDVVETIVDLRSTTPLVGPVPMNSIVDVDFVPDMENAATSAEVEALDRLWTRASIADGHCVFGQDQLDEAALPTHRRSAEVARRALDLVVSITMLVLLLPLMVVLAIAVKFSSPGAALFAQMRPGKDGQEFRMLKFRSMVDGADRTVAADEATRRTFEQSDFKLDGDDPRITGLGRFLRRTSLDELPQLINVLKGDMSIVGIRPLLPRQLEQRPAEDQMLFKLMRPGMTGLWQVEGRSDIGGDERVALDRRYVEQWSLVSDIKILARTPLAVISSSGAH